MYQSLLKGVSVAKKVTEKAPRKVIVMLPNDMIVFGTEDNEDPNLLRGVVFVKKWGNSDTLVNCVNGKGLVATATLSDPIDELRIGNFLFKMPIREG